jgi:hypothetical protein
MAKKIHNLISLTIILEIMKSFLRNPTHRQGISNNMKGCMNFPILIFGWSQFQFQFWFLKIKFKIDSWKGINKIKYPPNTGKILNTFTPKSTHKAKVVAKCQSRP